MRLKPLCPASALGLYSAGTAHAGLQNGISSFFDNMSYTSNTISVKTWRGRAARYVSGGSFYVHTGDKNIQLISISLPSINAGCDRTNVYLGMFSFMSSDQIMAFVKQMMTNATGYFFNLALETTVPKLKVAKDFLQKTAADIDRFNISDYQATKTIIDSVVLPWEESQQNVCQSVDGQKSVFSNWVASRQGYTSDGKYGSVADKATGTEKDQVLKDINLMWDVLGNSSFSSNAGLRQFAMSIGGSMIFGSNGELRVLPSIASDRSLLTAMMSGGMAKVYVCDNQDEYLPPTLDNVTISVDRSLIKVVQDVLTSIGNKVITGTPLTEKEKQFINSTPIPILPWIVDQSSLNVSQPLFAQPADYIAVDVYLQYLEAMMKVVSGSFVTKDYPGANVKEPRNGLSDARQVLNSLRMEVQIGEDVLTSAQQQIHLIRRRVSSEMSDRVLGNYQFNRVN